MPWRSISEVGRGTAGWSAVERGDHFHRKNAAQKETISSSRIGRSTMSDYDVWLLFIYCFLLYSVFSDSWYHSFLINTSNQPINQHYSHFTYKKMISKHINWPKSMNLGIETQFYIQNYSHYTKLTLFLETPKVKIWQIIFNKFCQFTGHEKSPSFFPFPISVTHEIFLCVFHHDATALSLCSFLFKLLFLLI